MSLRIAGLGALALVCGVAACSSGAAATDPGSTSDAIDNFRVPDEMTYCATDVDCVAVRMPTCCGNGNLVAVSKKNRADYLKFAAPRSCSHDPYACDDAVKPPDRLVAQCGHEPYYNYVGNAYDGAQGHCNMYPPQDTTAGE
jgi:hypothetical protein